METGGFTIIAIILTALVLTAMERDRIKEILRVILVVVTGAVLIPPFRQFLVRFVASLSTFTAAQMAHGEEEATPHTESVARVVQQPDQAAQAFTPEAAAALVHVPASRPASYHLNRFVLSVVLTALTVVFLAHDFSVVKPAIAAMGLVSVSAEDAKPQGAAQEDQFLLSSVSSLMSSLSALALIGVFILWGMLIIDVYGGTHFLPHLSRGLKRACCWLGVLTLLVGVVVASSMGGWRMEQASDTVQTPNQQAEFDGLLVVKGTSGSSPVGATEEAVSSTEEHEPASGHADWVRLFTGSMLPTLVLISTGVSLTGVLLLARYIAVFVVGLVLLIPALLVMFVLPFWDNVVGHLLLLKDAAIDWVASLGQRLINNVWPPVAAYRDALHERAQARARHWAAPGTPETPARPADADTRPSSGADEGARNGNGAGRTSPLSAQPLVREPAVAGHTNGNGSARAQEAAAAPAAPAGASIPPAGEEPQGTDLDDMNWGWPEWPAREPA